MANRTVKDAKTVKGTNPQYLVEKIIRTRIYESKYWKEECFALTAELLVDKAMELKYIGGTFGGNVKPTPFLCLILKMLQIQPDKDIVVEFITQQDFKYVRALGAMYMRLVGTSLDCYKYLEPLYYDYRKVKRMNKMGELELTHMDEFIDELLIEERVFDTILPRIQKRYVLEDENELEPRVSALEDEGAEDMESDEEEGEYKESRDAITSDTRAGGVNSTGRDWDKPRRSPSPRYRRSRSKSPHRRRGGSREREGRRERDHDRGRDKDRERDRDRDRERDRDRDRDRDRRRKRSHSRDKDRDRTRSRRDEKNDDGHHSRHHRHHHKSKRSHRERDGGTETDEIREANELRAKLGMAPLRP